MQIITTTVAAVTFNLVDELEAYLLIKRELSKPLTAAYQNCLKIFAVYAL
jgi:hypothetical protein